MVDASQIQEHAEIVGSDGQHVGTVEHMEGGRIKLTRNDPAAQGQHHYIHLDVVASVDGGTVRLTRTAAQAMDDWGSEAAGAEPGSARAGP
jgi:hypothetical protein